MKKVKQWLLRKERIIWLEYSLVALAILLPLLLPGYILTLDLVFTPHFSWPTELTNSYPVEVVFWLLNILLPGDIIEKIILFLILVLLGVGMHKVISQLRRGSVSLEIWRYGAYFAGIFYMINPFTYSRFMAGQWMVLAGYALLPFFVLSLQKLLREPNLRRSMKTAAWAAVIAVFSLHHIGIIVIVASLLMAVELWRRKGKELKRLAKYAGLMFVFSLVLTSFWWLPAIAGQSSLGLAVRDFNQQDMSAFATRSDGAMGALGEVIRLQGFWVESQRLYILPQDLIPAWGLFVLLLWIVIIVGAVKAWSSWRRVAIVALGSIVVGCVLAATPIVQLLAQTFPMLGAYREPHKFVNLVVFGYAILGAFGVVFLAQWARKKWRTTAGQITVCLGLLLPLIITPTMLWGFAGQLTPRHYPAEWYEVNRQLTEKTLFLPWHQYMNYSFSGRIIASPAEKFFAAPIIASDDPEFRKVSSTVPSREKKEIGEASKNKDDLAGVLRKYGIKRILLAKEDDYKKYAYLDDIKELRLLQENVKLKIYEVGTGGDAP